MLKALMLRKKIDDKNKALVALRDKDADFEKRESEIAEAINEAATEEEQAVVEQETEQFESDKTAHEEAKTSLEEEIRALEAELEELEKNYTPKPKMEEAGGEVEERKENKTMRTSVKFYGMDAQERDAFFAQDGVKKFISEVRTAIAEKRAINNVGLTIPQEMLPMIEQEVEENSKLLSKVHFVSLRGTGRALIAGSYPEAVWTEMCATLNELSLGFNDVEIDGYKVGGYFAVCNAILEDNDVNLIQTINKALGVAIAKALDKAIVYGTGTKMPQGIVTRLAETVAPSDYPATARTWVDLHTTNVITGTGKTGLNLYKEVAAHIMTIKNDYTSGGLIWIMNSKTRMKMLIEAMGVNANAAIVSGLDNVMPVVGGEIVELEFVPDDNVVVGYGEGYLLAQRAGIQMGSSEHVKFIEDQTVFKGTARYDGKPSIPEAFTVFTIGTTAPTTSGIPFAADTANP